jgi:hypothetical protein
MHDRYMIGLLAIGSVRAAAQGYAPVAMLRPQRRLLKQAVRVVPAADGEEALLAGTEGRAVEGFLFLAEIREVDVDTTGRAGAQRVPQPARRRAPRPRPAAPPPLGWRLHSRHDRAGPDVSQTRQAEAHRVREPGPFPRPRVAGHAPHSQQLRGLRSTRRPSVSGTAHASCQYTKLHSAFCTIRLVKIGSCSTRSTNSAKQP